MKQLASAEGTLAGSLGRLFALSEAYPDLKANTTMLSLMEELTSTPCNSSRLSHVMQSRVTPMAASLGEWLAAKALMPSSLSST
jgi:hypothetical protein